MTNKRLLRIGALATFGCFLSSTLGMVHPLSVEARVDPLNVIARQVQRPNILIVLDSSGSMTGVPGSPWSAMNEVGNDCFDGKSCRNPTTGNIGTCKTTGAQCASSAFCQTGNICKYNMTTCNGGTTCGAAPGYCAHSPTTSCFSSSDCPPLSDGTCKATGTACNTKNKPCAASLGCQYTGGGCSSEGASCGADGRCSSGSGGASGTGGAGGAGSGGAAGGIACSSDGNCPYTTAGVCQFTPGACSVDGDCPQSGYGKVCSVTPYASCTADSDCAPAQDSPTGPQHNCSTAGMKTCADAVTCCTKDADCSSSMRPCDNWRKCIFAPNRCILNHQKCDIIHPVNLCVNNNPCQLTPDTCTGMPTNSCVTAVTSDTCDCPGSCTAGSRMCSISNVLCNSDSQCQTGETCVPASSRMTVAKRVISDVVDQTYQLANYGLMTYYQSGYYQYYPVTGSVVTTNNVPVELGQGQLKAAGCFDKTSGPTSSCIVNGTTLTLKATGNSRYHVTREGHTDFDSTDANWCGYFCDVSAAGKGIYKGSYYTITQVTGTSYGTPVVQPTYKGQSYTSGGVTYVYMPVSADYYTSNSSPPILASTCTNANESGAATVGTQLCEYSMFAIDKLFLNASPITVNGLMGAANVTSGGLGTAVDLPNGGTFNNINCSGYNKTPTGCAALVANGSIDFHSVKATINADVYLNSSSGSKFINAVGSQQPSAPKTLGSDGILTSAQLTAAANELMTTFYKPVTPPTSTATYCMNGNCTDGYCGSGAGSGCSCVKNAANSCTFTYQAPTANTPLDVNITGNNNTGNIHWVFKAIPNAKAIYKVKWNCNGSCNGPVYVDFDYTGIGTGSIEMQVAGGWTIPQSTTMQVLNGGASPDLSKIEWYFDGGIAGSSTCGDSRCGNSVASSVCMPQQTQIVGRIFAGQSTVCLGQNATVGAAVLAKNLSISNGVTILGNVSMQSMLCSPKSAPPATCGAQCGGRWDTQLTANLLSPDESLQSQMRDDIMRAMRPAAYGGLLGWGSTPTGCTLFNDGAPDEKSSAYHYLAKVKASDPVAWDPAPTGCRTPAVLLITDGEANGPGDSGISNGGCGDTARCGDPNNLSSCKCAAVLNADKLYRDLNVKTYVVGFSFDAKAGTAAATNDNIARAGRTDANAYSDGSHQGSMPYAFQATDESELSVALQSAVYQAVKGWYETSPATASSGTQQANQISAGTIVLDSRVKFPSWEGSLLAYDVTTGKKLWDSAEIMNEANNDTSCGTPPYWATRHLFTSRNVPGDNSLIPIVTQTNCVSGKNVVTLSATTKSDLRTYAGLGANDTDTENIVKWLLGDPASGNRAKLGSIVNSTPIDVAGVGDGALPGQHAFWNQYKNRPALTYVGSDDGLLHAFFTSTQTISGTTFLGGTEAFAYFPPGMVPVIEALYANNGQPADPRQHIYGQASSPKVKNICVANCTDDASATWKTVLLMTEGYGANGVYALDITYPFSALGTAPAKVLWSSDTLNATDKGKLTADLGKTISVPGFYFNKSDSLDDYRVLLASGYQVDSTKPDQGRTMVAIRARDGAVMTENNIGALKSGACSQEYTVLADVATAKDYAKDALRGVDQMQKLLAAYVGDTWGQLYRYTLNTTGTVASVDVMKDGRNQNPFGCQQPLHFAPTVVQMDRDDPNAIHAHEIYIVQVTNSALDPDTAGFAESKMVFLKDYVDGSGTLKTDPTFGTDGKIEFQVTKDNRMCAVSDKLGNCTEALPSGARPLGTPLAVVKKDASGFIVISNWWVPPATNCGQGKTYMLIHDYYPPLVTLRQAVYVADEAISAPVIVGGKILEVGAGGLMDQSGSVSVRVGVGTTESRSAVAGEPFHVTGWTELP